MLGIVQAFESLGFAVDTVIAGDRVQPRFHEAGSERLLRESAAVRLLADATRILMAGASARLVAGKTAKTRYALAYERYGLFQRLGARANLDGPWVLEVNAILSSEATGDRKSTTSRVVARRSERSTFHRADRLVAVSQELKAGLVAHFDVPIEKVFVMPNGVDVRRFNSMHERKWPGEPRFVIVFAGALYWWQNVDALLKAATVSRVPLHLKIAGTGPELSSLVNLASTLPSHVRVDFLGRVSPDGVPALISSAHACYAGHDSGAKPTYFSPLKLYEYLAAGRPVISTAHSAALTLKSQGYPLVLTSAEPESIEDAIGCLAENYDEWAAIAVAAKARVAQEHSWEARLMSLMGHLEGTGLL